MSLEYNKRAFILPILFIVLGIISYLFPNSTLQLLGGSLAFIGVLVLVILLMFMGNFYNVAKKLRASSPIDGE